MKSENTHLQAGNETGSHETTNLSRRGFMMTTLHFVTDMANA